MAIRGVFFDLNGTLIVSRDDAAAWADWSAALWETLHAHVDGHDERTFRDACGTIMSMPEPPALGDSLSIYERRVQAFCRGLDASPDLGCIRAAAQASVAAWFHYMDLDPEAIPLLQEVRRTCRTALVSNFDHPAKIHRCIQDLELGELFDTVVVSGDLGCCKPDPAIFRHALETLDLRPEETLHVGDADEDILGARAANCMPVRIRRNGSSTSVDESCCAVVISRLGELASIVSSL